MIVSGIMTLLGQGLGLLGNRGKAAQERMNVRVSAMERSWTDEFLVVVWFYDRILAVFDPAAAEAYLYAVSQAPVDHIAMQVAITGAVFGLGKVKGRK